MDKKYKLGLEKSEVKLNSSNYGYGQKAADANKGRFLNHGEKAYSAFANPKDRTIPMAGCKDVGK